MRLGQLARQLDIKTDEIVAFLASKQIVVDPGNNTKLEDEHTSLVVKQYAPEQNIAPSLPTEPVPEVAKVQEEQPVVTDEHPAEAEFSEPPDLIKAPKVELPGLKVLGKIELPEKKRKEPEGEPLPETEQTPDSESVIPKPEPARRPRHEDRPRRESRPWRNPLEEQRRREDREKKRKLEEEREVAKQRKAEYYKKRLKPQPPTKAVRQIHKEEMEEMPVMEAPRPRTWLGRFMAWLNGR